MGSTPLFGFDRLGEPQCARWCAGPTSGSRLHSCLIETRLLQRGSRTVMAPQMAVLAAACPPTRTRPASVPWMAVPACQSVRACASGLCALLSSELSFSGLLSCGSPPCDLLPFCGLLIFGRLSSGRLLCALLFYDSAVLRAPVLRPAVLRITDLRPGALRAAVLRRVVFRAPVLRGRPGLRRLLGMTPSVV